MSIEGWYYLHTNGELIYKREFGETAADIRESPFAHGLWSFDTSNRSVAWKICIEGLAAGAKKERVMELAKKWECDDTDAKVYAARVGVTLGEDGNQKTAHAEEFVDLQKDPCGFGDTYLEAMADLCKQLGYKPSKMWGNSFNDLLRKEKATP